MAALDSDSIRTRFESVALATEIVIDDDTGETLGIKTFFFDDLSQANKSRNIDYPLFLMKPMDSEKPNKHDPWENYTMEFFVFGLEGQKDADERAIEWGRMKRLAEQFLVDLEASTPTPATNPQDIHIVGIVVKENGHHKEHADQLIGVKFTGTLRIYDGKCN